MNENKRPDNDELPPPTDFQTETNHSTSIVNPPSNKFREIFFAYIITPALLLAFLGGCWWVGENGKRKREAKEAAEQTKMTEHANKFKNFATSHSALVFEPFEHIPGLGEITSDVQASLKRKPVALEIFPDLREVNGALHLTDALGGSSWLFDLEVNDAQAAIARQAHSQNRMVWVIAEIRQSNAKEEPRPQGSGTTEMQLIIRSTGKVVDCQIAPN